MTKKQELDFRLRNLLFVDIETTGLNWNCHEILEIGYVLVSGKDLSIVREGEWKVKPEKIETADPQALELVGYSGKLWEAARPLKEVMEDFGQLSPGAILTGWNVTFDFTFLDVAAKRLLAPWDFDYHRFDVLSMVYPKIFRKPEIKGISLRKVAPLFGINHEGHSALRDARVTYQIFCKLMEQ